MSKTANMKQKMPGQQGDFVKVGAAQNQAEAEFLQGMLREEGIPSMLRRAPGFDVPDFLAAGPRDVLVPAAAADAAADVLLQTDTGAREPGPRTVGRVRRVVTGLLLALALLAILVWCTTELFV